MKFIILKTFLNKSAIMIYALFVINLRSMIFLQIYDLWIKILQLIEIREKEEQRAEPGGGFPSG